MSPLSYKGSISEAINEALAHKKLFVVFISGDDDGSKYLVQSTFVDQRVVDAVLKYCIFLHLYAGTEDASQFSVIYPQNSIPSISIIGYNGVMTSQHDGFITADSFLESVENARECMKLQDTAAVLLSAALASRNIESFTPGNLEELEKGSSSTGETPSSSGGGKSDQIIQEASGNNSSINPTVEDGMSRVADKVLAEEPESSDSNSEVLKKSSEIEKEADFVSAGSSKTLNPKPRLTDVHLSIRLPNGSRLQLSSPLTDTLQSVKKYVIENNASNLGAFDLAIPYPRKVFTNQDMSLPLSELGFSGREALIVVPHKHADVAPRSSLSSFQSEDLQRENEGGGPFGLLKRIISFVNPFSYLGGASHTSAPAQIPGAASQGNPYRDERFYRSYGSDEQNPSAGSKNSASHSQGPATFGGNIHTLRDVEHKDPSDDGNLFWNGNSTEFGGNDKK